MMKIVAALAVATTVQTASAGNRNTLKLNGQTYLQVTNETTWPFPPTIKVKNVDYGEPALEDAWVYVDGVWTSTDSEGGEVMRCDKDNVPNTSGNHNCTEPKFIRLDVSGNWWQGRGDAATCTSTTGFDYVGEALLQDPARTDPTVEGGDYMIVNMYGAGNNYCRYLCQETERCMFYTIGNGRCYLKGAGAKKKAGKKNAKKEGGSCIPDPNTPTEPPNGDKSDDPCNAIKCGKQCKGRLFTYPNRDGPGFLSGGNLNMAVPHDCGWSKSAGACVTGSHTGPNEKKLESFSGACTDAPTAAPTPAPVTVAPVLATPAPRNCRKQCAGKFDKLKRGKGKQSLAKVCGLKNCNQCVECTRPPMVNYTLYQGSSDDDTNCPAGCNDVESEADVYGNTTWSCLANNSGTAENLILKTFAPPDSVAKNCAPTYYPDQPSSPRGGCPFGCVAQFGPIDDTPVAAFVGVSVCVTAMPGPRDLRESPLGGILFDSGVDDDEWVPTVPAALCTGPVDLGRRCMPMEDFISARPFFDLPAPTRSRKETVQVADAQSPIATRVVLTPKAGTPCMPACDDPASPSCQNCCRTVTHETDWSCQTTAGSSSTAASCCTGDWDATCWNVASAANNDHACNQCLPPVIPFNWDFTTKVIKTIKKKGFWETHCQLACYDRENCGAYVYTKGTCKLFRTLPINEATAEQFETGLSDLSEKSKFTFGKTDRVRKQNAGSGMIDEVVRLLKVFGIKNHGFNNASPVRELEMSWKKFRASGVCLSTTQFQALMEIAVLTESPGQPCSTYDTCSNDADTCATNCCCTG